MEALSVQAGIEVFIELQDKMAKNSQQYEQLAHTSKCKADHLTLDTFKVIHFANINLDLFILLQMSAAISHNSLSGSCLLIFKKLM